MRTTFFALTLALAWTNSAAAENWERFRGPNGAGTVADKDVPVTFDAKQNVLWKLTMPGPGHSSPVVWGKHLFLQTSSADGKQRLLLCIDVTTGKELWSRGAPGVMAPKHGLNSFASATPATDGHAVFVPFWDGKEVIMAAYDMKGAPLWTKNLGGWTSQHGAGASPILYKDTVIFANDMDAQNPKTKAPVPRPSILYALSKKTGNVVWETPREGFRACYSMPFILEAKGQAPELLVTSTTAINSYNPDTGAENWKWQWDWTGFKFPLRTIAASMYLDGMLFSCSGDGGGDRQMTAVSLNGFGKSASPKEIWRNRKDFPYVPCLLSKGEQIYFVNDAGIAGCYEAKTGKRVWSERIPNAKFSASPLMIDGKVYAASEQGDVHVFAASPTYQLIASNRLGEMIRATPAVADGRLYVRGETHLFCIGKK